MRSVTSVVFVHLCCPFIRRCGQPLSDLLTKTTGRVDGMQAAGSCCALCELDPLFHFIAPIAKCVYQRHI